MEKLELFLLILPILQTNLAAQTWEFVGLDSLLIKQIYVSGDTIWAGTDARINTNMVAGVYKSTDVGSTWNQLDSTLGDGTSVCFYKNPINNLLYIVKGASEWSLAGTFYKSTDQGENWQLINQLESIPIDWIGISPFNKNEIYALNNGYVELLFRSTDGGENWEQIGSFPSSSHGNRVTIALDQVNESTLYAAVDDRIGGEYFYVSTNKGDSWNYISEPPGVPAELINDSEISGRIYTSSVYITEDGGYTWELANSGLPDTSYYWSFYESPLNRNEIYTLRSDGLYKSGKENIYWNRIEGTEYFPLYGSYSIYEDIGQLRNVFIDTLRNEIYVGTASGIYKKDLVTNVKQNKNDQPTEFILYQNYPNPFNPSTTISYYISEKSFIIIKVYDVLGNEIRTLIAGEKSQGEYQIEFNGTGLTSGVYFYVLSVVTEKGERIKYGRKMILIK